MDSGKVNAILKLELAGEQVNRYTPDVGKWMWNMKSKWDKFTVEELAQLQQLKCFQDVRDFYNKEEKRMFQLCLEFEQKHPQNLITARQMVNENPIGSWISGVKREITSNLGSNRDSRKKFEKQLLEYKRLRTIQEWLKTRKPSWYETTNKKMEDLLKNLGAGESQISDCDILQVSSGASLEVVKGAYKALALKHHPDKGGDHATFSKIQSAYQNILKKLT